MPISRWGLLPVASFKIFHYHFLTFMLFSVLWASWFCALVSDINLGGFLTHCFKYFFCFFLSLCYGIPSIPITPFVVVQQFLSTLVVFFPSLFLFTFQCWKFLLIVCLTAEILSLAVLSLMSPSEAFFVTVTVFFISGISFCSF